MLEGWPSDSGKGENNLFRYWLSFLSSETECTWWVNPCMHIWPLPILLTSLQSAFQRSCDWNNFFFVLRQLLLDCLQRMSTHSDGNTLGLTKHTPPDVAEVNYFLYIFPIYVGVLEFHNTNEKSCHSSKKYCNFLQFRLAWISEIVMEWILHPD